MTCSMPSIEVGTVGGGTVLAPQAGVLDILFKVLIPFLETTPVS